MTPSLSIRQLIRQKPAAVKQVIQCLATRKAVEIDGPLPEVEIERLMQESLNDWEKLYLEAAAMIPEGHGGISESDLAEGVIKGLRGQEVWGKILRGNAN